MTSSSIDFLILNGMNFLRINGDDPMEQSRVRRSGRRHGEEG